MHKLPLTCFGFIFLFSFFFFLEMTRRLLTLMCFDSLFPCRKENPYMQKWYIHNAFIQKGTKDTWRATVGNVGLQNNNNNDSIKKKDVNLD